MSWAGMFNRGVLYVADWKEFLGKMREWTDRKMKMGDRGCLEGYGRWEEQLRLTLLFET